jgi:hypothetical protein
MWKIPAKYGILEMLVSEASKTSEVSGNFRSSGAKDSRVSMLSPARRDEVIESLAQKVQGWGLVAPAIFLLEAHKPLSFLGSQLLLLTQPILRFFVADVLVDDTAALLEEPRNVERLILRLEELAQTGSED